MIFKKSIVNGELRKMNLRGNWHKTDIDSEHLSFAEFLTGTGQKKLCLQKLYIIFIIRCREVANIKYAEICKELFHLNERLQKTWCILAKQKYGKATNLTLSTCENIFDYSFDFNSMLIEKGVEQTIRLYFKT